MDVDCVFQRVTRQRKATPGISWAPPVPAITSSNLGSCKYLKPRPSSGWRLGLTSHCSATAGVTGAAVCCVQRVSPSPRLPPRLTETLGRLAWLELSSREGHEYWAAMNLMGDYASANHAVLHRRVTGLLGAEILSVVENHHNFAWLETHGGRELVVHRKGATPAGRGVLGVIPGSMGDPAFVVRGTGNAASLHSASHGAGRRMSRTQAHHTFRFTQVRQEFAGEESKCSRRDRTRCPGSTRTSAR